MKVLLFLAFFLIFVLYILGRASRRRLKDLRKLYERFLKVEEIGREILSPLNLEELFSLTFLAVKEVVPSTGKILLFWLDKDAIPPRISLRKALGVNKKEREEVSFLLEEAGSISRAILSREPVLVKRGKGNNLQDQRLFQTFNLNSSLLIIPIFTLRKLLGALLVERKGRKWREEDIESLLFLARYTSIALENAELYQRLENLAIVDELTGVYNRRYFEDSLDREIKRALRYSHPLSLLMADIDFFKIYNDRNGHLAGDKVLQQVARVFKLNLRETDIISRYGGEEFTIILTETPKKEALTKAEEIRGKVEKEIFPGERSQPQGSLTLSIGVASFPEDAKNKEELVKKADQALYKAKQEGRNRVAFHSPYH